MTAAADSRFEVAVASIAAAVEKVNAVWPDIVAAVHQAVAATPALGATLGGALAELSAHVTDVVNVLSRLVSERGDVAAIRQAGSDWNTAVGRVAAEQAGRVGLGQLPSYGLWSGAAATRYTQVALGQKQALADVKTTTDALQTTLNEIADALTGFWVLVAGETAAWLATMIVCAVTTALGGVAAAIVASVVFGGTVLKQEADFVSLLDSKRAKLEQLTTLDGTYPNGQWPPAVDNTLADATVHDGDASAWTPTT